MNIGMVECVQYNQNVVVEDYTIEHQKCVIAQEVINGIQRIVRDV